MNRGDRIRLVGTDEDGLPFVRYGFITPNSPDPTSSPTVTVMLDGELSGETVPFQHVELVTVANIELRLFGADLVDDPTLRRGLLPMWLAWTTTRWRLRNRLATTERAVADLRTVVATPTPTIAPEAEAQ